MFRDHVSVRIKNNSTIPAENIHYIIDVYNANDVNGINASFTEYSDELLGVRHSLSGSNSGILVRMISNEVPFEVIHKNEEYLIHVNFWCKNLDYDYVFFTYRPNKEEITTTVRFKYEKVTFIDEVRRVSSLEIKESEHP